ncbi:MAG TPA: CarD family transcriptional regulator [Anaerolineae bacterium]|nr:CarD family transcriptional regulator [Anaerolineae bacterium]
MFGAGDLIFHPRNGCGTIRSLTRRDPFHPGQNGVAGEAIADQTQDYYDIQLLDGGTMYVPVSRAERLGLRLLTNGLETITVCMHLPPLSLPRDSRERAAELLRRSQMSEPTALVAAVRDLLAQSRGRALTASETTWLRKSCERLSIEAALVDGISKSQAYDAIWETVKQLSAA